MLTASCPPKVTADSGNRVRRGFCPKCGAQMFSKTVEPVGQPAYAVGTGRMHAGAVLPSPDAVVSILAPNAAAESVASAAGKGSLRLVLVGS